MRRMPTSFPVLVSVDRAGQRLLSWHSVLWVCCARPRRRHLCWRSEGAGQEFVPFCLLAAVSHPQRDQGCCGSLPPGGSSSARYRPRGTGFSSPPLTSHKDQVSPLPGAVCAADSPAPTFLPPTQALRLEQAWAGTRAAPHSSCRRAALPHPTSLAVRAQGSFCGTCILPFLEISLRLSGDQGTNSAPEQRVDARSAACKPSGLGLVT